MILISSLKYIYYLLKFKWRNIKHFRYCHHKDLRHNEFYQEHLEGKETNLPLISHVVFDSDGGRASRCFDCESTGEHVGHYRVHLRESNYTQRLAEKNV